MKFGDCHSAYLKIICIQYYVQCKYHIYKSTVCYTIYFTTSIENIVGKEKLDKGKRLTYIIVIYDHFSVPFGLIPFVFLKYYNMKV